MCFGLYDVELHHVGEDITLERLREGTVKWVDCVWYHHLVIVQIFILGNFLTVDIFSGREFSHA